MPYLTGDMTRNASNGCANYNLGILKDLLLNWSLATCVADNNPDNSIARVVDFTFAGNPHIVRFTGRASSATASLTETLRNMGDTANLKTTGQDDCCGYARMLYSDNVMCLELPWSTPSVGLIVFNSGDPIGWHVGYCDGTSFYHANTDTASALVLPVIEFTTPDAEIVLFPSDLYYTVAGIKYSSDYQDQANRVRMIDRDLLPVGFYTINGVIYVCCAAPGSDRILCSDN